ncbi:MAG: hypothetical protein KF713_15390 [Turneriella sp.]|nr:hypothetical protein [Turneriella sp.]
MRKAYPTCTLCWMLLFWGGAPAFAADAEPTAARKKLIFVNFYNETGNQNIAYLESSIVDSIHELIKDKYSYDRVTAADWAKTVAQRGLSATDLYNPEKLQQAGAAFRADGIIFGKLSNHPQGILITGKILSVIEKEVIAEKELVAPLNAEMFESVNAISEALAKKIKDLFIPSDWGAVRRSALLPGWGQFYKQRKAWGYFWGITVAASFLMASYFTYSYIKNNSAYRNAGPEDNPTALYQKAESAYGAMNVLWYITGGLYLLNLIDAYLFHGDYSLQKPAKTAFLPEKIFVTVGNYSAANPNLRTPETWIQIAWRLSL